MSSVSVIVPALNEEKPIAGAVRLDHVARFIVNAADARRLSNAATAERKTEREPPRPRSDESILHL
jgi:hypothetical protein